MKLRSMTSKSVDRIFRRKSSVHAVHDISSNLPPGIEGGVGYRSPVQGKSARKKSYKMLNGTFSGLRNHEINRFDNNNNSGNRNNNRSGRSINNTIDNANQRNNNNNDNANNNSDYVQGKLRMVVTDTGAGISSSNQQKLFREIVQFNPEVLQAGGGSGLGLWITSSIVDLHGGTISVYSDGLGRGSTFTVEIDMNRLISYTRYFDRLDRPNPSFPSPFPYPSPFPSSVPSLSPINNVSQAQSLAITTPPSALRCSLPRVSPGEYSSNFPEHCPGENDNENEKSMSSCDMLRHSSRRKEDSLNPFISAEGVLGRDRDVSILLDTDELSGTLQAMSYLQDIAHSTNNSYTDNNNNYNYENNNNDNNDNDNNSIDDNSNTISISNNNNSNNDTRPNTNTNNTNNNINNINTNVEQHTRRTVNTCTTSRPTSVAGSGKTDRSYVRNTHTDISGDAYDVLVVDDSSLNRKMLCKLFRTAGYTYEEAEDGIDAVEKVKSRMVRAVRGEREYDAILMDFVMPHMDGPTATREIRNLGYQGAIYGVTGNALESDINYFVSCGADAVLAKPFDFTLFKQLMWDRKVSHA